MPVASGGLVRLAAALLVCAAPALPATAVPIVYTFQGTLVQIVGTTDSLELVGATLVVVATADTDDAPVLTSSLSGVAAGTYDPTSLSATFSNRPGGAPDVMLTYTSQIQASNRFPPASGADALFLFAAPATFEGIEVAMPAFSVFFLDQGFLPGTAIPPLPHFAPANVASVPAGTLNDGQSFYALESRSATAVVPEPGAALGVVLALGTLALLLLQPASEGAPRRQRGRASSRRTEGETAASERFDSSTKAR